MTAHDTPRDTTAVELEQVLARAASARSPVARTTVSTRQVLMEACAQALLDHADELVELAGRETHLPDARLRGEVVRSAHQFRQYADALSAGILRTDTTASDPRAQPLPVPDLRRTVRPVGVVLVFTASNFPFAFGVAGTDTASALAAGCPVVVKAHPGHPRLSRLLGEVLDRTLLDHGAPEGTLAVIFGTDTGVEALKDHRVSAASFTGSVHGGRFLFDVATSRPTPIPFYGELGSINPVVVGAAAARREPDRIAREFFDSFTLGSGQFCTKPGVVFWPVDVPLPRSLLDLVSAARVGEMLDDRIAGGYRTSVAQVAGDSRLLAASAPDTDAPRVALHGSTTRELLHDRASLLDECFGPSAVVVTYDGHGDLVASLQLLEGSLTATLQVDDDDRELVAEVLPLLEEVAGRVIWNQWPTGVAVDVAQQHGGPYPASTSSLHTSVGPHAIERFVRPVAYQNFPPQFLPVELRTTGPSATTPEPT